MASAGFIENCQSAGANPRVRVTYDGTRYDDQVIKASNIHRDSSLSSGNVGITLENTSGDWNFLKNTGTTLGAAASIALKFAGTETLPIYTGTVMGVQYRGAEATITLQDKMHRMLETRIGSGTDPERSFTAVAPSDLPWDILTSAAGGLSSTANDTNPDIDYDDWNAWTVYMKANLDYSVGTEFTGQTIRDILLLIATMTDSYIWVNGRGRFDFAFAGDTGQIYDGDNSSIIDLDVETSNMVNQMKLSYGYNRLDDTWVGVITSNYVAGQTQFGLYTDINENKTIWHKNVNSGSDYTAHLTHRYGRSQRTLDIETGLTGFLDDIGSDITVSETLKSITSQSARVEDITYNLNNSHTRIKARWPF